MAVYSILGIETVGGIFALSTAGNVLGALLTTFVLLRFLGTAAAALAIVGFPALNLWVEATQYVERNAYADYRIVQLEDGGREAARRWA